MNFLKKLLLVVVIIFFITITGLWILTKLVKPTVIKDYLSKQITLLTKQENLIDGELSWQLFPRPGLKISEITIGNINNKNNYCIKLKNITFNLKITPLLEGNIVFSNVIVNGFTVMLPMLVNSSLAQAQSEKKDLQQLKDITLPEVENNNAKRFAVERILLTQGQIIINHATDVVRIYDLQFGADHFNLHNLAFPVRLKGKLNLLNAGKIYSKTHFKFGGSLSLDATLLKSSAKLLQELPLQGKLELNNFNWHQFKIDKISTVIKLHPGLVKFNPLSAKLYKGEAVGDVYYNYLQDRITINQAFTNIDSASLLEDLFNKDKLLKGNIDFSLHAQINLKNLQTSLLDNINANGSVTVKDGVIGGVNLDQLIMNLSQVISNIVHKKNLISSLDKTQFLSFLQGGATYFKVFTLQYNLTKAKLITNPLMLQTDTLSLTGDSVLNLKTNHVNSHLFIKTTFADSELDRIQHFLGGNFPLSITGSLNRPVILPDLKIINNLLAASFLHDTLSNKGIIKKQINKLLSKKLTLGSSANHALGLS